MTVRHVGGDARGVLRVLTTVVAVLILAACAGGGGTPTSGSVVLVVDASLVPPIAALPELGGRPRPLAVLEDADGARVSFVADELWVATDDRASLDAVLARWNGVVLLELDPAAAGVGGLERQYLVRIDPTLADASTLSDDLKALDPTAQGSGAVSSAAGLGVLTAGAREAAAGHTVGVNWVGQGADVGTSSARDRDLAEAPSGTDLGSTVPYTPNPFAWPTHDVGSPQDIGVAEAWRALDLAGRLVAGSVKVAILDMGFEPDADTPDGWTAVSNVILTEPIGTENQQGCGTPCPWHGTNVMSAAFAVPGNGFGSAGPAGPVAEPLLIFANYDFFTAVAALLQARARGAKIANLSYSAEIPGLAAVLVLPFDIATFAIRASGMLMFASAGNAEPGKAAKNVDAEQTIGGVGLGFERAWHTPCENVGVICVAGLFTNSLSRASGSNYGSEQVDLFAPFSVWVGPDPLAPANEAQRRDGTSFSSPFAAGVAALIWAADPSLSANDVESLLFDHAKSSPDAQVGAVIDALGAVRAALGNIPPAVDVVRPLPGAELTLNQTVFFDALVEDFEDGFGCCEVTWTSNLDGPLGTGRATSSTFDAIGARIISVAAVDSEGAITTIDVHVTVVNDAPRVEITKPVPEDEIFQGVATTLRGTSFDANEPGAKLTCSALVWTSSNPADADFPTSGCEVQVTFATLGSRTITLTGTDPQGAADTDTATAVVVGAPPDLPPSVLITSPQNFQSVQTDEQITLSGNVSDPEAATPITLVWTVSVNGASPIQVGTGNDVPWTPHDTIDFSGADRYDVTIRLTAQDPGGNSGSDFVQLRFIIVD